MTSTASKSFFRSRGAACSIHITPWSDPASARGVVVTPLSILRVRECLRAANRCDRFESRRSGDRSPPHRTRRSFDLGTRLRCWICDRGSRRGDASRDWRSVHGGGGRPLLSRVDRWNRMRRGRIDVSVRDLGVVGLFGAATLPEFRGRGVQNALVARRWPRQAGRDASSHSSRRCLEAHRIATFFGVDSSWSTRRCR